jgi:peptidoglycan-associated lipoprotein
MTEVLSLSNVMRIGKLGLVTGCFLGMVVGCSSRLQTTIMSGTESSSEPQVAQIEPVAPHAEVTAQAPVQAEEIIGIPPMDIPVEEPARPAIRPSAPAEIFATPRTGVADPAASAPFDESEVPSSPQIATAPSQVAPQEPLETPGIPPISVEPEIPAIPTIREESGPQEGPLAQGEFGSIQESDSAPLPFMEQKSFEPDEQAPIPEEPVQMAKVDPAAAERAESRTDDLMKALGDVYFDYDRFTVRKDAISVLQENAKVLLTGLSDQSLVIEGHCDERGTESYNMVLGDRRANAVKEFLVNLGIPKEKIQVVSFGKEKPFCTDQNEQCWQENRRGHFVLR